jgi:hypothetical protein
MVFFAGDMVLIDAQRGAPAVPLIHDDEVWQKRLAALPLTTYGAGETVFTEGTRTGRLLILRTGLVSVIKGGTEIAQVAEPGVIFGELSALLNQPHTADVRTMEESQFHVAAPPHYSAKTQSHFFTLRPSWRGASMTPTKSSLSSRTSFRPANL